MHVEGMPEGVQDQPRSHFEVNGVRHPLWAADARYLTLESIRAENGMSTVWDATYEEPETGIVHQTVVKKFTASPSEDQLNQIHNELSVLFTASSRWAAFSATNIEESHGAGFALCPSFFIWHLSLSKSAEITEQSMALHASCPETFHSAGMLC